MPERLAAWAAALALSACAAAGVQDELGGRTWTLVEIEGAPVAAPGRSTLLVAEDGKVSGAGGCNRYSGKAEVAEDAVTFGPLLATKRACEPDAMQQEVRLFEGLRRAAAWRIDAAGLTLLGADGAALLRFSAAK